MPTREDALKLYPGSDLTCSDVSLVSEYYEQYYELEFECGECGRAWCVKGHGYELPEDALLCPNGCNDPDAD